MPSLGADMDVGTLVEWLVKPGDTVRKGDAIAVVDTSKSVVDVECFESGTIERLIVPPGQTVPVGTPLALIAAPTTAPAVAMPVGPVPPAPAPVAAGVPAGPPAPLARPPWPRVTPVVRKLATQIGVDLASVHGSGRGGAITRADVERAARERRAPRPTPAPALSRAAARPKVSPLARRLAAQFGVDPATMSGDRVVTAAAVRAAARRAEPQPAPAESLAARPTEPRRAEPEPVDRLGQPGRLTAALMARSKREIPHYYLATDVDLHHAMAWLLERNRQVPIEDRLVPAALLMRAVALAAREIPDLNGHWVDGAFVPSPAVDLGLAVSLHGGGLLVPTLQDAAAQSALDMMRWLRAVVRRVRTGRLRSSELAPGSITITNLGDLGVGLVHGVIYPPQVALVGFGAVRDRPWAVDGLLGIRPVITATLAADHRATDGAVGGRFLHAVERLLQTPEEL